MNNGDTGERVRRYLESQVERGQQFGLGGTIQDIYGTARAEDLTDERALIEYVLRFANGEEDTDRRQWSLETQRKRHEQHLQLTTRVADALARTSGELVPERIEAARIRLRDVLVSIHEDRQQALGDSSATLLRGVWGLPVLRREPTVHLSTAWVCTDINAFNALVSVLLLDAERPFGRDLCRCRLEGCGRFFILQKKSTPGVPRRLYCSEEHMTEAHQRGANARTAKSRARRARKAKKSK